MKKMLRITGVMLIVCALMLFLVAAAGKDTAQGTKVSVGYKVNGVYKESNDFYMGRNQQGVENMEALMGIAVLCGAIGIGAIAGSAAVKDETTPEY